MRGAEGARPWDRDWSTVPDPLGEEALPLGGGGVRVVVLGQPGDHQGVEEPERYPRGVGQPQRTMRGSSGQ